jgi:hypothetical protein
MIGGRGEQALGPFYALGTRHCVLPSGRPAHPFPAARAPPLPRGHGNRMCVADAGGDEPEFPER